MSMHVGLTDHEALNLLESEAWERYRLAVKDFSPKQAEEDEPAVWESLQKVLRMIEERRQRLPKRKQLTRRCL